MDTDIIDNIEKKWQGKIQPTPSSALAYVPTYLHIYTHITAKERTLQAEIDQLESHIVTKDTTISSTFPSPVPPHTILTPPQKT